MTRVPLPRDRRIRPALTVAAAGLVAGMFVMPGAAGARPSTAGEAASGGIAALPSVIPIWAMGRPSATEPTAAPIRFDVVLAQRDPAGLVRFDRRVSDPTSSSYRQFLSARGYRERFAPTAAEAATVRGWLHSAGLRVTGTSANRGVVSAAGDAATVARAFDVTFARWRVGGQLLRAPLSEPVIPASVRPDILAVSGLAQTVMQSTLAQAGAHPDASPAPAFVIGSPCSKYYGQRRATAQPSYDGRHQPLAVCGYTPRQLRSAYGVTKTHLNGKGVTVAIVDAYASPTIKTDVNTYSKRHGLPRLAKHQLTQDLYPGAYQTPQDPTGLGVVDPQGWAGEETLDVEAVHSMAPKAHIHYVAAAAPEDATLFHAEDQVVESDSAQVISNSYGSSADSPDPADKTYFDMVTSQAASEGITIDFSSGDDGDEVAAEQERVADFPATSTGVTAVGGTTLRINRRNHYAGEVYWGTDKITPNSKGTSWKLSTATAYGSGGGGVSTSYPEPSWQKRVVPHRLATHGGVSPGRVEPDVSMDADSTTGFRMGQTETFANGKTHYGEYRIGGTSLSCPLFSGLVALAVQRHDRSTGKGHSATGLGLITPTLYKASHGRRAEHRIFHDPRRAPLRHHLSTIANVRPDHKDATNPKSPETYSLRSLGNLSTLHALRGYDDSTGLGTPKAPKLVKLLG
jgi:subtilase family serine protease